MLGVLGLLPRPAVCVWRCFGPARCTELCVVSVVWIGLRFGLYG
jgi:hypothetical protein